MAYRAPVSSLFASLSSSLSSSASAPPPGLAAAEARTLSLLATLHAASAARGALASAGSGTVAIAACIACESLPQPIPQSAFEKQSGLRPAAFRASLAELRGVLAQTRAASASASAAASPRTSAASSPRTPSRRAQGSPASGSKRAAEEPLDEDRSPAALRARAMAVQSGAAWGLQRSGGREASEGQRTPSRSQAAKAGAQTTPSRQGASAASQASSAASTPRSVRFGTGPDDETPQTPTRGAAKTLFAPLPHTPSRGSRLRPMDEAEPDDSHDLDGSRSIDEPPVPAPDDGERAYAFALYPRLREAWAVADAEQLDARVEQWQTRLAAARALDEGSWDADGWGSLPLAAQ